MLSSPELLLELLRCPRCSSRLRENTRSLECPACGYVAPLVGPKLAGFREADYSDANSIVRWPKDMAEEIEQRLVAHGANETAGNGLSKVLTSSGLLDSHGRLTALGALLRYHSLEYEWQKNYDVLEGLVSLSDLPAVSRILDLGCGSGQTIRNLSLPPEALCIGVDYSAEALAYGSVVSRGGPPHLFCCASAYRLPLTSESFDLVISRASINYCHQETFLREALRVLRPGGLLFCRVEQIWWDLNVLSQTKSILNGLYAARNLLWGKLFDLIGVQPFPGGVLRGSRAYVSRTRFQTTIRQLGGKVLRFEDSSHGPQFRGHGTQAKVLCRRND
jgi:SAM-dependent methyltransferase